MSSAESETPPAAGPGGPGEGAPKRLWWGHPEAERVVVVMGSGADVVQETVENLVKKGEKVGVVKIRLYRPFPLDAFIKALPKTVKKIAVLDRTKEPGALGEPIYLDVRTAIGEAMAAGKIKFNGYPVIVGGRYGLGSKEFNPAMAKAVLDNLKAAKPKNKFVVGIEEDVTGCSLKVDYSYKNPMDGVYEAMFFGLGSDGTVGANKNSIKIIGEETSNNAQAYFVYDSKKAGSMTTSHLRFGKKYIRAPYLVQEADFVACHNFSFLEKYDMLARAKTGATFLLIALAEIGDKTQLRSTGFNTDWKVSDDLKFEFDAHHSTSATRPNSKFGSYSTMDFGLFAQGNAIAYYDQKFPIFSLPTTKFDASKLLLTGSQFVSNLSEQIGRASCRERV